MRSVSGRKVVITGAGAVGATFAFALAQSGVADEIVLIDSNEKLAHGQALDLLHGQSFFPTVDIRSGGASEYGDADIIVITAGRAQRLLPRTLSSLIPLPFSHNPLYKNITVSD